MIKRMPSNVRTCRRARAVCQWQTSERCSDSEADCNRTHNYTCKQTPSVIGTMHL